jgi:hypothetical protein
MAGIAKKQGGRWLRSFQQFHYITTGRRDHVALS